MAAAPGPSSWLHHPKTYLLLTSSMFSSSEHNKIGLTCLTSAQMHQGHPAERASQPVPTEVMRVVPGGGGNRNAKNLPEGKDGREWSHGLCGCCDEPGTCKSVIPILDTIADWKRII